MPIVGNSDKRQVNNSENNDFTNLLLSKVMAINTS